jgi:hypothetical protein
MRMGRRVACSRDHRASFPLTYTLALAGPPSYLYHTYRRRKYFESFVEVRPLNKKLSPQSTELRRGNLELGRQITP